MATLGGPLILGIDLGGTKILAGVVDAGQAILGRAKVATPAQEGAAALTEALRACAGEALAAAGVGPHEVAGVGIGSPGPLDAERGLILHSANLNVRDYPLGPTVANVLGGRPVRVVNDVRAGGYGEFRLGAGRGYRNVIAAFVGTGVGGCVIVDDKVITGVTGNAGELGHIVVKAGGPKCGCGRRGCLEALASRSAMGRRIAKAARRGVSTVLAEKVRSKHDRIKSKELAAAFAARDPVAVREVRRAAHFLGLGLGSLVNVLAPEIVIVGGGVTEAIGRPYIELVRQAARPHILADPEGRIRIEPAALGDDAGILGAALLAREAFAQS